MRKSLIMMVSLIFVASALLAGCGKSDNGGGASNTGANGGNKPEGAKVESFELKMRHIEIGEPNKNRLARLEAVKKKTEEQVPGLTMKLDGVDSEVNRKDKLRSEMAAGNPPDIFDAFGSPDIGVYAKEGLVLDIGPILDELNLKERFINLDPWTYDGKIYGLPKGGSIEGYFYNKEYFAAKGLEVPKTLAELEALAETVKADGKVPFAQGSKDAWVPLMTTNNLWSYYAGADFTAGFKTGESKWNDPKMVEAVSKHQEWVQKGYFKKGELGIDYNSQRNQLLTDEAVMMYDGSWASSVFNDALDADGKSKFGFFVMPPLNEGDGFSSMVDSNNGYAFSAKAAEDPQKLEAIKAFISTFFSDEIQLQSLKEDGLLPSMILSEEDLQANAANDLIKEIILRMNELEYKWPAFDALVQAEVNTELSGGIHRVIEGVQSPKDMLDALQKVQDEANAAGE
ncbi:ABC transporter substrate-binding protein [Paenibacillus lentus]|uniref:ABC transporter substrate-binding protein n=1 Tax=Paenibacillus lentus TaxID=1338368 RepID=UPI00364C0CF5